MVIPQRTDMIGDTAEGTDTADRQHDSHPVLLSPTADFLLVGLAVTLCALTAAALLV